MCLARKPRILVSWLILSWHSHCQQVIFWSYARVLDVDAHPHYCYCAHETGVKHALRAI